MKISGVTLSLSKKEPDSLWVKAEFDSVQWQEIQKLTDTGINDFFNKYNSCEYFSGNVFDKDKKVVWSPLVYKFRLHKNMQNTKYQELSEPLQQLCTAGGTEYLQYGNVLETCFYLQNCLLFGYNTPGGGHFELKNSQNETIAMQHNFYQSYDEKAPEYDLPSRNPTIEISVPNNLLKKLAEYDVHMSENLFYTRWGTDYYNPRIKLTMATYYNPYTNGDTQLKTRQTWPGYATKQKTL